MKTFFFIYANSKGSVHTVSSGPAPFVEYILQYPKILQVDTYGPDQTV